jgi:hypothetical protein
LHGAARWNASADRLGQAEGRGMDRPKRRRDQMSAQVFADGRLTGDEGGEIWEPIEPAAMP